MKKDLLILSSKKYPKELTIYDVENFVGGIKLYYSKLGGSWSHPGKLGFSLTDIGNGLIFKDYISNKTSKFDYTAAEALRALLKLIDTNNDTFELLERK